MVRDYASDRVGTHMSADMIKGLIFDRDVTDLFFHPRVRVRCDGRMEYFIRPERPYPESRDWYPSHYIDFEYAQFDERNFPQHFDISLFWPNSRQQDEMEAMGAEDGIPASVPPPWWWWSATPQDAPVVPPLQWTRVGEGKWVSSPPLTPETQNL